MSELRTIILVLFGLVLSFGGYSQDDSLSNEGIESWLNDGKYDKVIDSLSPNISEATSFSTFYNLGIAYEEKGSHLEALWCFESALKIKPSASNAQHNASFVYSKMNGDEVWSHPYSWWDRLFIAFESVWSFLLIISVLLLGVIIFLKIARTKIKSFKWIKRTWIIWLLLCLISLYGINKVNIHYNTHTKALLVDQNQTTYISAEGVLANDQVELPTRLSIENYNADSSFVSFRLNGETLWIDASNALMY